MEQTPGSEYRAHKAGGDVKKKGKPDPYAYLPLTRAALNKRYVVVLKKKNCQLIKQYLVVRTNISIFRKKKKMATKLRGIVAGAKKGAQIGMKNKRSNK